jgi:protein-disulfide isomerase
MTAYLTRPIGPDDHTMGPPNASYQLVEYGDYECPYCGAAHPIVKSVQHRMGDSLLFAYRHFPLTQVHPHAEHAAEIAEAAGERGRFWAMHDMLFTHQHALDDDSLVVYAARLGIDAGWARWVLQTNAFADRVHEHFLSGVRSGVNGTPTFFVNGIRHEGPWDEASLIEALRTSAVFAGRR